MKVILKAARLVLVPENDGEAADLAAWKAEHADHVLHAHATAGVGLALAGLGRKAEACREPVAVWSRSADPAVRLIGNFAATPFYLDGEHFGSVEGFWQALKFTDPVERRRVSGLAGGEARGAGQAVPYSPTVTYRGEEVAVGTSSHWALMERACRAKFTQHLEAREALLATGERPLVHRMRRDSKTIPGAILAEIWMRVRAGLLGNRG